MHPDLVEAAWTIFGASVLGSLIWMLLNLGG